ncbi:fasciclin domain-containing protein [Deinococcus marmoris]|uniref:Sensory subunit of low CO2-induced protein complex n=1 Tax=Deinococcus marmoris TaxID=249408 RepID=A0A1U7NSG8_9DEIO|nr:fasciclin domain-containing protein [Deinococcus marmoris]OLV15869.1 Sensory subunit of low CO2-induced protein complex [Deinococcus marmoris]
MFKKTTLMLTGALMLSAVGAAQTTPAPTQTIAEIVSTNPDFSTLLAAVKAAGLVETLSGAGPFTVFAPTNAAFAKIPAADLNALINDPEKLKSILLYHVVVGKAMAADVIELTTAKTVNGAAVNIKVNGGKVMVNDATVIQADVQATNGVIHVIDTVLMPPANAMATPAATAAAAAAPTAAMAEPTETITGIISTDPDLTTLLAAVKAADLEATLIGKGPFTLFAPTNAAFAKIPKADLDALLADPAKLKAVLLYHVVAGQVMAADVVKLTTADTVNGAAVDIQVDGSTVAINNATITRTDVPAINGVVHFIDTVLMPPVK